MKDNTWTGIAAFYAIVNLPSGDLVQALQEMMRVLIPGGRLLLSFHIGEDTSQVEELWELWGCARIPLLSRGHCRQDHMRGAGFEIEEIIERDPYAPEVEFQSRRAYIFAHKPMTKIDIRMTRKFYITTPIYYVNARPHIGHAYTTIACDTIARRQRLLGADTFFLTGTDEHGQKIERAAQAAGKTPQQYADEISAEFRKLWQRMGISNDDFIRTTEERHKKRLQELFRRIRDNGYIYKGTYTGQYCVSDELYVDGAQPGDPCPTCGRITETVHEENYFFKLSAFQDKLLELYANPEFIRPETRRNEVISFVRSGLRDQSISRSTFSWGIPVP